MLVQFSSSHFVPLCVCEVPACGCWHLDLLFKAADSSSGRLGHKLLSTFLFMNICSADIFQYVLLSQRCCYGHSLQSLRAQARHFLVVRAQRSDGCGGQHLFGSARRRAAATGVAESAPTPTPTLTPRHDRLLHFFTHTWCYQAFTFLCVELFLIVVLILTFSLVRLNEFMYVY